MYKYFVREILPLNEKLGKDLGMDGEENDE